MVLVLMIIVPVVTRWMLWTQCNHHPSSHRCTQQHVAEASIRNPKCAETIFITFETKSVSCASACMHMDKNLAIKHDNGIRKHVGTRTLISDTAEPKLYELDITRTMLKFNGDLKILTIPSTLNVWLSDVAKFHSTTTLIFAPLTFTISTSVPNYQRLTQCIPRCSSHIILTWNWHSKDCTLIHWIYNIWVCSFPPHDHSLVDSFPIQYHYL